MPFSFLLKAHVPDSRKCCMSLWRVSEGAGEGEVVWREEKNGTEWEEDSSGRCGSRKDADVNIFKVKKLV